MSWFSGLLDSLFSSGSASASDALMGGTTDFGPLASGYSPWADAAKAASEGIDYGGLAKGIAGLAGGGVDSANPAMFDPNTVGPPPPVSGSTLGSVAPNQGGSVVGSFSDAGGSFGGDSVDPESLAREGTATNSWNPSTQSPVGSTVQQPPPPTAWESIQQAPGKWWQGVSSEFNQAPISTSMKVGTGLASVGLPIAAAAMAPKPPKPISYDPIAPMPLPGTTGTGRADIPAASPMTNLGRTGGFQIGQNTGLTKKKTNGT